MTFTFVSPDATRRSQGHVMGLVETIILPALPRQARGPFPAAPSTGLRRGQWASSAALPDDGVTHNAGFAHQFILGADGKPIVLELPLDLCDRPIVPFTPRELARSRYTGVAEPDGGASATAVTLALLCRRLEANVRAVDRAYADEARARWLALETLPGKIDRALIRVGLAIRRVKRHGLSHEPAQQLGRRLREFKVQQTKAMSLVLEPDSYAYLLRPAPGCSAAGRYG